MTPRALLNPRALRRLLPSRPSTPAAGGPCADLLAAPADATPVTPEGCAECLAQGTAWVHLRLCLTCGHVGCCDSGQYKHARVHADATGHPVMRSFEAGESWRWCYRHELLG